MSEAAGGWQCDSQLFLCHQHQQLLQPWQGTAAHYAKGKGECRTLPRLKQHSGRRSSGLSGTSLIKSTAEHRRWRHNQQALVFLAAGRKSGKHKAADTDDEDSEEAGEAEQPEFDLESIER